jgi:hypothetical protein
VIVWKPEYVATATMLITSQQIPKDFVRSTVEEDQLANISGMIGEVLSAERLSDLIDHNKLFRTPAQSAADRPDQPDALSRHRGASKRPAGGAASLVYEISYESREPQEARDRQQSHRCAVRRREHGAAQQQARRTTVFLRSAMERTEKELREQSGRITEFPPGSPRRAARGAGDEPAPARACSSTARVAAQQITGKEDRLLSISRTAARLRRTRS